MFIPKPNNCETKDMVKGVIDEVDISYITFKNKRKHVMGSFSPDNLQLMYQLPEPQNLYNKQFLEKFSKENKDLSDVMYTWRLSRGKLKRDKTSM